MTLLQQVGCWGFVRSGAYVSPATVENDGEHPLRLDWD